MMNGYPRLQRSTTHSRSRSRSRSHAHANCSTLLCTVEVYVYGGLHCHISQQKTVNALPGVAFWEAAQSHGLAIVATVRASSCGSTCIGLAPTTVVITTTATATTLPTDMNRRS